MGLVMAAAALFELSPHEPAYQGKRLSEWLTEKSFSAITGLAQIGPDAVLPLVQCLTNETPYLRSAAMISLSMIKPENETALRAVVERLDDRDNRVRATAANALRSFWNKPELVVPPLIKGLSDSDGTVRVQDRKSVV